MEISAERGPGGFTPATLVVSPDTLPSVHVSQRDMRMTLAAMTLASSMILVDQTAAVRKADHIKPVPIFSRRSRWIYASQGRSSAITKRPSP